MLMLKVSLSFFFSFTSLSTVFQENKEEFVGANQFADVIASISDVKFSPDGRHLLSRGFYCLAYLIVGFDGAALLDFFNVKIWDVNMESRPVAVVPIHGVFSPLKMIFDRLIL